MFTFLKQQLKKKNTNIIVISVLLLVVAGSFLINHFFFSNVEQVEAWYSDNWLYRQGIPIQNSGGEREDYQVAITVDTSTPIGAGKMQALCQDIRFSSKITGKELPYWIESGCNSASTKIWVKVDKLPFSASSTYSTIDMYYGNPVAQKGEDGNRTFLFFDDFNNDLSKWEVALRDTSVSSQNSTSTVQITTEGSVKLAPSDRHHASANIISNDTFTNGVAIESSRKQDINSNYVTFSLGAGNLQNDDGNETDWYQTYKASGYSWNMHQESSHSDNMITEIAPDVADSSLAGSLTIVDTSTYARHQYFYESSGDLWWYIDDSLIGSATDTTYLSNEKKLMFTQGELTDGTGDVQEIDWVFVRKYDEQETEPVMGTAQVEEQGKGAVGYWKFDEGFGTTAHDQAQNNDGAITGATWKNEEECVSGKCLYFDGDQDYVDMPDNIVASSSFNFSTGDFTLEAWFKTSSLPDATDVELISKRGSGGTGEGYDLRIDSTSVLNCVIEDGDGNNVSGKGIADVVDGKWHHAVAVFDRSNDCTLYLDGVVDAVFDISSVSGIASGDSQILRIGADAKNAATFDFDGYIDEPRIYNYARTADEIKTDYLAGVEGMSASFGNTGGLSDDLIMHLKMDEIAGWDGTASEVVDSSSLGNHGTSTNANTTSSAKFGMSGDFNGSDAFVDVNKDFTDENLSISAWFYGDDVSTSSWIINKYKDTADALGIRVNSGNISVYEDIDGGDEDLYSTGVSTGQWYHTVLIIKEDLTLEFYVNGKLIGNNVKASDSLSSFAGAFYIGQRGTGSSYFDGQIDQIRVYKRALTQKDVDRLYNEMPPPVAHYKFDERTGTTTYDSTGSKDGTFNNDPAWKGAGECVRGGCLDFDGVDDNVEVADTTNSDLDIQGEITVMLWMRADAHTDAAGTANATILSKGSEYRLYLSDTNGTMVWYNKSLSDTNLASTDEVPLHKWIHVAATYSVSEGVKRIYIDGKMNNEESAGSYGNMAVNDTSLIIGDNTAAGTREFNGRLDDVRIYNYALSEGQIIQAMQSGATAVSNRASSLNNIQSPSGPILYYDFEHFGVASTSDYTDVRSIVYDISGRGNHGVAYNATSTLGKFGNSISLDDSTDDCIELPNFSSTSQTYTFSMWVNTIETGAGGIYMFDISDGRLILGMTTSGSNNIGFFDGAWKNFGTFPEDGVWHHFSWLFDSTNSEAKLYIDGQKFGDTQTYTAKNIGGDIKLGGHNATCGSNYLGKLDEFKIYEYLLTEEEIKLEYNRGKVLQVASAQNPNITGAASGNHPGGDAPVMHLNFNEGRGTTSTDRTGNGNDGGKAEGTSAPTWKGVGFCPKGNCLEFDGTQHVSVVNDASINFGTGSFSVGAWVNTDKLGSTQMALGKSNGVAVGTDEGYLLGLGGGGTAWRFYVMADGTSAQAAAATSPEIGKWYHLIGVWDTVANVATLYVDGVFAGESGAVVGNIDVSENLYIGAADNQLKFDGKIDEVKIWDRALTPAEVAYDYNGGKPVGHWKFDEGDGDWAYDASGKGNHGYVRIGESGTNTATSTAWQNGASGVFNGALDFDGTDDFVKINDTSELRFDNAVEDFSISSWVNFSTADTGDSIIDKRDENDDGWRVGFINDGRVICSVDSLDTFSDISINDNTWHHVLCSIDRDGNSQIYIDGLADGKPKAIASEVMATTANVLIGAAIGNVYTTSTIDDVRIYNYTLNAAQVKQVYNNGKALLFK